MNKIEVNGKQVEIKVNKTSSNYHPSHYRHQIHRWFARIGIEPEFISIDYNNYAHEEPFANIKWKVNGDKFFYECRSQDTNKGCLAAIEQLVHKEVIFIERGIKSFGQAMNQFRLGYDESGKKIKFPREIIGVSVDCHDLDYIEYKYKQKAKELHSDHGGDIESMQELNEAIKTLREELKEG